MKITKHGHACLEIESQGKRLLIDPGSYTQAMAQTKDLVGVVMTHFHDDHCFPEQISEIVLAHPGVRLFGPEDVVQKLSGFDVTRVMHGDHFELAGFEIDFYGDLHQIIHRSIPVCQNVGVMVNSTLYYPGDSYTFPEVTPKILAVPTSAPWLRISDVIDFVEQIKPSMAFPTHNALLSEAGHKLQNSRVAEFVQKHGGEFRYLEVGQSWDL